MAASSRRKRPNSITNLLGDVLDDAKELADDALDRAGGVERDARRAARRVVSGSSQDDEVDSLKAALDDLTAKVERLASLRAENGKRG